MRDHITIIKAGLQSATCSYFCYSTLRRLWLVSVATPPRLTYSVHRDRLDNHGTSQPLRWCRQSEPFIFIEPGSANNNFLRLAAFAQRTRKARLLLTCGAIHLVPPPASCGEERRMCAFPLNCHTTSGSFQRDSAVLTLKGCHSTRSQPVMAYWQAAGDFTGKIRDPDSPV